MITNKLTNVICWYIDQRTVAWHWTQPQSEWSNTDLGEAGLTRGDGASRSALRSPHFFEEADFVKRPRFISTLRVREETAEQLDRFIPGSGTTAPDALSS